MRIPFDCNKTPARIELQLVTNKQFAEQYFDCISVVLVHVGTLGNSDMLNIAHFFYSSRDNSF